MLSQPILDWLKTEAPGLWLLVRMGSSDSVVATERFHFFMQNVLRKTASKKPEKLNSDLLTQSFMKHLRLWASKNRLQNQQQANQPLSWQDEQRKWIYLMPEKLWALVSAFLLDWPIRKSNHYFGNSKQSVQFQAFEALVEISGLTNADVAILEPNCARFDLHYVDWFQNVEWSDRLNIFNKTHFDQHLKSCNRCQALHQKLKAKIQQFKHEAHQARAELDIEPLQSITFSAASSMDWPWILRLGFQLLMVSAAIFAVLSLPYIGELIPKKKQKPTLVANMQKKEERVEQVVAPPVVAPSPVSAPTSAVALAKGVPSPQPVLAQTRPVQTLPSPLPSAKSKVALPVVAQAPVQSPSVSAKDVGTTTEFYRIGATSLHLDEDAKKVMQVLKKYDVQRAGELDLGAIYKGGRYFHFTIPKNDFASFIKELNTLGFDKLTQQKAQSADRKIPTDLSRIVLWVGSGDSP